MRAAINKGAFVDYFFFKSIFVCFGICSLTAKDCYCFSNEADSEAFDLSNSLDCILEFLIRHLPRLSL